MDMLPFSTFCVYFVDRSIYIQPMISFIPLLLQTGNIAFENQADIPGSRALGGNRLFMQGHI